MKIYTYFAVLAFGLSSSVLARGGGHGSHFHGGGWHGGSVPHHYYHHHGQYHHYYDGGGWRARYGYWPGMFLWPGYFTGGPVGYYNHPVRCVQHRVCNHRHGCHWQRRCHRL